MMRPAVVAAIVGFLVLSFGSVAAVHHRHGGVCHGEREEIVRIQTHLERVEHELLVGDVSHLTPGQRAARERNILALRAYRLRGRFPHNHDLPERMPYFIDRHGTRCAMAYLIERAGGADLVRRVAAAANNARIAELAEDRDLLGWLDREGLTLAEAARIQPEYEPSVTSEDWQPLYGVATVCASALALGAIVLNEQEPSEMSLFTRRDRGDFALAMGVLCVGVGIPGLSAPDDGSRGCGALNLAIGVLATAVGIAGISGEPSEDDGRAVSAPRFSLAAVPGGGSRGGGAALVLRF